MIIKGMQKLTLLDYPEKLACILFTPGCNFRCSFCHNASLVVHNDSECFSESEFFDYLNKRKGIIEGVVISGGEPTLQHDLIDFIIEIKKREFSVKLDTNGYKPDVLIELVQRNLIDYVAMDIKNSMDKYSLTAGINVVDISRIKQSVDFLLSDTVDYEFRTTVVKELHTKDDMLKIGEWISGAKHYFLQSFIDSGDVICPGFSAYDEKDMENLLNLIKPYVPSAKIR